MQALSQSAPSAALGAPAIEVDAVGPAMDLDVAEEAAVPSATSTMEKGIQVRPFFRSKESQADVRPDTCEFTTQTTTVTYCSQFTQTEPLFEEEDPMFSSTPVKQPPAPMSPAYTPSKMTDVSSDSSHNNTMEWETNTNFESE